MKSTLSRHLVYAVFAALILPASLASAVSKEELREGKSVFLAQLAKVSQSPSRACPAAYRKIFSGDTLKISLYFGYENFDSATTDAMHHGAMVGTLTHACAPGIYACGFKITRRLRNYTVLEKMLDGKKVQISVYSTSITENNDANMDWMNKPKLYAEQERESQSVKNQFYTDLVKNDVVFYMGHSRVGAGLGFNSQTWLQEAVNYVFRMPLQPILSSLAYRPSNLKVFGLFSCSSDKYYRAEIERVNPNISLILSGDEVDFDEAPQSEIGALNALLGKQCSKEFHESMVTTVAPDHRVMEFIHRAR